PEWDHGAPLFEQRAERLADGGASLDGHRAHFRIVVDALHRRDIDDHPHVGIRYESLEAVPAAGHNGTSAFFHCFLDRGYYLICRVDQPHVVRARAESLVESLLYN